MVDGAFDPLHRGHIEYFRAAVAQLDVPLLCNVASDSYVRTKHAPLLPEDQRAAVVDAIRFISYTHVNQFDTETILRELRPKCVKGRTGKGVSPDQVRICGEHGIGSSTSIPSYFSRILKSYTEQQSQR